MASRRFWRNIVLICAAVIVLIVGLQVAGIHGPEGGTTLADSQKVTMLSCIQGAGQSPPSKLADALWACRTMNPTLYDNLIKVYGSP